MNIARLGAAGGAAAIVALSAAGPAFAADPAPPAGGSESTPSAPSTEPPSTPPTTPTPTRPTHPKPPGHGPSASVSPTVFSPGDTLTFTVQHCAVRPNISDLNHLFASVSPFHHTGWRNYAAQGVTRTDLVEGRVYRVTVHCGRWSETFSTRPRKHTTPTPPAGEPTGVPSGAPQTGDGSSGGAESRWSRAAPASSSPVSRAAPTSTAAGVRRLEPEWEPSGPRRPSRPRRDGRRAGRGHGRRLWRGRGQGPRGRPPPSRRRRPPR